MIVEKSNPVSHRWKTEALGNIVEKERPISYGIVQTGPAVDNGVKCIRVTDLVNGTIHTTNLITTSTAISDSYRRTQLRKNDLVMALRGKIGEVAIVGDDLVGANLTRGVALVAPKSDYDPLFIKQLLCSSRVKELLRKSLNGSALQELSIGVLRGIPISFPENIFEQRAIASVLSDFDLAISKTEALIAQKELRKKGLMQQLLTGKKRLKGFSSPWRSIKMNEIFDRVTRKNDSGCKRVVTISGRLGFVVQTDYFKKSIASDILDNYFLLFNGEFSYNKSYSNGYPWGAIKRLNSEEAAVVTSLYICFRIKEGSAVNGLYMESFFESGGLNRGLMRIAHEGGRAHGLLNVTPEDFFSLTLSIPEKAEQDAIAQVLQTADKEIELLNGKAEKIREQKKGLMQVLLTGKKRLKEFRP